MLVFSPIIALALALIAIGRGALQGQFLEVERKRDRITRHICFGLGVAILIASLLWMIF
jgi:hypothetical protein